MTPFLRFHYLVGILCFILLVNYLNLRKDYTECYNLKLDTHADIICLDLETLSDELILITKSEDFQKYVNEYSNIPSEEIKDYTVEECLKILITIPESSSNKEIKEYIDNYNSYLEKLSELDKKKEELNKLDELLQKKEKALDIISWPI